MRRNASGLLVAFLLFAACASTHVPGQGRRDNTYFIEGIVVDRSGNPVKHARLALSTYDYDRQAAAFSNDEGKFIFERLTEGNYRLNVSASGCANHEDLIGLFSTSRNLRVVLAPASPAEVLPDRDKAVVSTKALIVPPEAREEYGKALRAKKNKETKTAREHLDKALLLCPQYAAAHAAIGFLLLDEHKTREAETAFQMALAIEPMLSDALLGMGRIRNGESRFAEAEELLLKARSKDEDTWQVNYELGRACAGLGKDPEAKNYLREATAASPDFAPVYYLFAQVLLRLDRPLDAVPQMEAYLRIAPEGPTADTVRDLIRRIKEWSSR